MTDQKESLRPREFVLLAQGYTKSGTLTTHREICGFKALDGYMVEVVDSTILSDDGFGVEAYFKPERKSYTIFVPVDSIEKLKDVFFDTEPDDDQTIK